MASHVGASSKESLFSEAVSTACAVLNVERLYKDQYEALKHFFAGQDIFFSAHTGYGKSLIFQAIPIIYDVMHYQAIGTSTVIVVSPLLSLIKDHVQQVNENCRISAVKQQSTSFNFSFKPVRFLTSVRHRLQIYSDKLCTTNGKSLRSSTILFFPLTRFRSVPFPNELKHKIQHSFDDAPTCDAMLLYLQF